MDVNSAFLQADIDQEIYTEQPEGFQSSEHPDHVCRLKKSLYGLKQAPRLWNNTLDEHLRDNGFAPTDADPCIYIGEMGGNVAIISIYVDDCVIYAPAATLAQVKQLLTSKFRITDYGELTSILGIEVDRDRKSRSLRIRQSGHINDLLETYGMSDCVPAATPLPAGICLDKPEKPDEEASKFPYRQAVGKLLYIAIATRPDIAFAVQWLSRFCAAYDHQHWDALKQLLRYLRGTRTLSIMYRAGDRPFAEVSCGLAAYCDADWGGNPIDHKSVTGYMFFFASGPISWRSTAQTIVAQSSTEAEYLALSETAKQTIYLRKLFEPLGIPTIEPTTIYCDNQSAIMLANSPPHSYHARTKHFDIRHHFIRETIANRQTQLIYCPSSDNIADILTKSLPKPRFENLRTRAAFCEK
jgi:hypothetical protein